MASRGLFEWIVANRSNFASVGGFAINLSATSLSNPEVMRYLQKVLPLIVTQENRLLAPTDGRVTVRLDAWEAVCRRHSGGCRTERNDRMADHGTRGGVVIKGRERVN